MKTRTWESLCIFDSPEFENRFKFIESPLEIPKGVEKLLRDNWNNQLKQKQKQLAKENIYTEIQPSLIDNFEQPLNALYECGELKMWPGPVVSLKDIKITGLGIDLFVGQTSFPFIEGLKDRKISRLYAKQKIIKPRPALAICTYALTQDNKLTLNVNGSRTNMYPGRLSGQGGNPLFTNINLVKHQRDEMEDEILVRGEECDFSSLKFSGILIDNEQLPNKPDLVGWIKVNLEARDIQERVCKRSYDKRPNDTVGVVFAPSKEGELFDYLAQKTSLIQYAPPSHGGLVLYGHHNFGPSWSRDLLKRLK